MNPGYPVCETGVLAELVLAKNPNSIATKPSPFGKTCENADLKKFSAKITVQLVTISAFLRNLLNLTTKIEKLKFKV